MVRSSSKLAFLAVLLLVLEASSSLAVARHHHHEPDPCCNVVDGAPGLLRHRDHRCSSAHGGGTRGDDGERVRKGSGRRGTVGDGRYHDNSEMIVALSTRWYAGGWRCHKPIRITSAQHKGRTVVARVVDECDSRHGCKNNIVDSSKAVWEALGLNTKIGEVPVTWSDA